MPLEAVQSGNFSKNLTDLYFHKPEVLLDEKVCKYVTENFTSLAAAGVGTVALVLLHIHAIKRVTKLPTSLETADKDQLQSLLEQADVSVGHWNGRRICFKGSSEQATFRQVSRRIEQLYSKSLEVMYTKQERASESMTIGALLSFINPLYFLGLFLLLPELNVRQEFQVRDAIEWRKKAYGQLNVLFENSQTQIDEHSRELTRAWDKALDKVSSWRGVPVTKDCRMLEKMVKNRSKIGTVPSARAFKAHVDGKNFVSRLHFGMGVLEYGAAVTSAVVLYLLTALFSSQSWRDSCKEKIVEEVRDLRLSALGVFNPAAAYNKLLKDE